MMILFEEILHENKKPMRIIRLFYQQIAYLHNNCTLTKNEMGYSRENEF